MKCHIWNVLALGMALGGAAVITVAATDPVTRRRMCRKARCIGDRVMEFCESRMK